MRRQRSCATCSSSPPPCQAPPCSPCPPCPPRCSRSPPSPEISPLLAFSPEFHIFTCAGKEKSRPLELCGGRDARTDDTSYFSLLRGWGLLLLPLLLLAPCPVLLTLLLGRTHLAVVAQVHLGGARKMSLIKAPPFWSKIAKWEPKSVLTRI